MSCLERHSLIIVFVLQLLQLKLLKAKNSLFAKRSSAKTMNSIFLGLMGTLMLLKNDMSARH